jgi:hypothetical protein
MTRRRQKKRTMWTWISSWKSESTLYTSVRLRRKSRLGTSARSLATTGLWSESHTSGSEVYAWHRMISCSGLSLRNPSGSSGASGGSRLVQSMSGLLVSSLGNGTLPAGGRPHARMSNMHVGEWGTARCLQVADELMSA